MRPTLLCDYNFALKDAARGKRCVEAMQEDFFTQNNVLMQRARHRTDLQLPAGLISASSFALFIPVFLALALGGCSHDQGPNVMGQQRRR